MNKRLSLTLCALFSVLLIVLLAAPKIIGLRLASSEAHTRLQEMTGQQDLELSFTKGWFAQTAQLTVPEPTISGIQYSGQTFTASMKIFNGPLMLTPNGPRWGLAYIELVPRSDNHDINTVINGLSIDEQSPFIIMVGMDGALQLTLPQREVSYDNSYGISANAKLSAQVDLSRDGSAALEVQVLDLLLKESLQEQISLGQLNIASQTERLDRAAIPGKGSVEARNLRISAQEPLTIDRISLEYSALEELADGTFSLQQHIHLENFVSTIAIEDLKWSFIVDDIDAELADNYIQLMRNSSTTGLNPNNAAMAQSVAQFTQSSRLLLVQKPISLASTISMDAFEGHHEADLTVSWPGLPNVSNADVIPFAQVVTGLDANLNLNADADSIQRTPLAATMNTYIRQGVLTVNQGMIEINARLAEGTLYFNEQSLPLTPFLDL